MTETLCKDRVLHLYNERGVCRDCGQTNPENANLAAMAEECAERAIRCAVTALQYDVPISLDDGAKWAALATFLSSRAGGPIII